MAIDVSVIIVNWNTRALLARAITSVRQWAGKLSVETIVVDNASTDGSVEMIRHLYSNVQLIANSENVGYTRACNQGLAVARGRYILFLNADAELTPGCLEALVRVMEAHPDIGACSPSWTPDGKGVPAGVFPRLWLRLLPTEWNWQIERRMIESWRRDDEGYDVEWIVGAVLLVRREVVAQIGGMEERLFMWYDDADWCLRMKRHGWRRVIVPYAYAKHAQGAAVAQLPSAQAEFRMTMAEYTFWRLHKGRIATALLYFVRLARLSVKAALAFGKTILSRRHRPEKAEAERRAIQRLIWHLRHAADILWRPPRPYRAEDVGQ